MAQGGGSVSSPIAELREDVDALDTLMGDTSISGIGNGTVTGAISTINNNLPKYKDTTNYLTFTLNNYKASANLATEIQIDKSRIVSIMCIDDSGFATGSPTFCYSPTSGLVWAISSDQSGTIQARFRVVYI